MIGHVLIADDYSFHLQPTAAHNTMASSQATVTHIQILFPIYPPTVIAVLHNELGQSRLPGEF
jgi:hypothetical protein